MKTHGIAYVLPLQRKRNSFQIEQRLLFFVEVSSCCERQRPLSVRPPSRYLNAPRRCVRGRCVIASVSIDQIDFFQHAHTCRSIYLTANLRTCDIMAALFQPSTPQVIRDASAGAVDSILKFAQRNGETLALSACATHLVDLLSRAELPSVTNQQRSWFFRRLVGNLRAFPYGGWELAAAYLGGCRDGVGPDDGGGDGDEARLLRDLARGAVPGSERAAHELIGWCRANGLGEETAAAVSRARGGAWIAKTGFSAVAMGIAEGGEGRGDDARVPGACGKAAYWLAKAGGGVQLERLCAEVSERLMVEVPSRSGGAAGVEVRPPG